MNTFLLIIAGLSALFRALCRINRVGDICSRAMCRRVLRTLYLYRARDVERNISLYYRVDGEVVILLGDLRGYRNYFLYLYELRLRAFLYGADGGDLDRVLLVRLAVLTYGCLRNGAEGGLIGCLLAGLDS